MAAATHRGVGLANKLKPRRRGILAACFGALLVLLAATAANAVFGVGGRAAERFVRDWISSSVYILVALIVALRAVNISSKRLPWVLFSAGLSLYGLGNVLWSLWIEHLNDVPIPSVCDGLWLTLYPLSYAGILGLARGRGARSLPAGVWLDGLIAGTGLAAIGATIVFSPVLASATGSTAAVATELAYPIGDLLLAALVVGILTLRGWRVDRVWGLLVAGFLLLTVADCMYALQVADGSSSPSAMTNLMYLAAVSLLAFAAWQPEVPGNRRLESWSVLLIPAGFTLAALLLLIYDHFNRLDPLALALAIVTLVAAILRMALAFREVRSLADARREAATDELTRLPNRRMFLRRLESAVTAARMTDGRLSVLILDLDNFKQLNDTLGHHAGDALLRQIGPRLRLALRHTDTVARLGGDEFAVLLDPQPSEASTIRVAEKLLAALREPFVVTGLALRVTGSLGIASFPQDADDGGGLLKRADVAMYLAKRARGGFEFYTKERDQNSRERLMLATEFSAALERGGIEVHFQPKATAGGRRIVGAEALVRWRRDDGSVLMPGQFIEVVEHAGLSRALTRQVLELALRQLSEWRRAGHELHVAANTTVADLLDAEFPTEVAAALQKHGVPPHALVLEVTESSILSDPLRIGNVLARLGELGIELSLDDFGTGYSSLTHLRTLPVGEIKVDRSFVSRMCRDASDAAIVHASLELAHRLGMRVVAEGVEDDETWTRLAELGCETVQGYGVGLPVPAAELEALLQGQTLRDQAPPKLAS
jgi:diguanylate cyclase (GGDEF)-like protein